MRDVYVISSCRTAVGKFGGSLKDVPAAELGSIVMAEALKRGNVKGEWLDEVMFGNVLSAAQGQNVARQCMVKAGIPLKVPAYTVSMVCGSGLKSVIEGSRAIQCGDADMVMCGGTENMSAAPYAIPEARWGARMGEKKLIDTMIKDGLWDAYTTITWAPPLRTSAISGASPGQSWMRSASTPRERPSPPSSPAGSRMRSCPSP